MFAGAKSVPYQLPAGKIVRIDSASGAAGSVRMLGPGPTFEPMGEKSIEPHTVTVLGPYDHATRGWVTASKGVLEFEIYDAHVAAVAPKPAPAPSLAVPSVTQNAPSSIPPRAPAAPVATPAPAKDAPKMGLHEKFANLAAQAKAVPAALSAKADAIAARLSAAEAKGHGAFAKMDAVIADVEAGVKATEEAVAQLTNGAPLAPSAKS
jgi:hypothetical protein